MENKLSIQKDVLKREISRYEIKEKIKELYYVRRWPPTDVMRELRISGKKLGEYLSEIKKDLLDETDLNLQREIANNVYHSYRTILSYLWVIVDDESVKTYNKLKALELINNIEMNNIDALQKIGVLTRPVEKHEITMKSDYVNMMADWQKRRRKENIIDVA